MTTTALRPTGQPDVVALPTVIDNARYAWRDGGIADAVFHGDSEFEADWSRELEPVAVAALDELLPQVWARHGYLMAAVTAEQVANRPATGVPNAVRWAVWDAAADLLDPAALIEAADLRAEYRHHHES